MSIIFFILSCLTLIATISSCLYSLYDLNRIANELANNPSASGIDYLGNGWEYGIMLFAMSSFGLAVSTISSKLFKNKRAPKYISIASIIIFVLLLMTSIAIFYS
jgi:hypothetical protein